ncbi:hypothetical protein PG985_007319 [Apiospora marii]|uniref:Uncharacterized protein n=1 Tax=Apiospora marii TaxID=335849 RepID=A0ABR1SP95_9PEZI
MLVVVRNERGLLKPLAADYRQTLLSERADAYTAPPQPVGAKCETRGGSYDSSGHALCTEFFPQTPPSWGKDGP